MIITIDTNGSATDREVASVYFDLLQDSKTRETELAKLGRLCACGARTTTDCAGCGTPLCVHCTFIMESDDLCVACCTDGYPVWWVTSSALVNKN